jgi:hypothetical protein
VSVRVPRLTPSRVLCCSCVVGGQMSDAKAAPPPAAPPVAAVLDGTANAAAPAPAAAVAEGKSKPAAAAGTAAKFATTECPICLTTFTEDDVVRAAAPLRSCSAASSSADLRPPVRCAVRRCM